MAPLDVHGDMMLTEGMMLILELQFNNIDSQYGVYHLKWDMNTNT